jgi:rhodanese-related sulfurtransferase
MTSSGIRRLFPLLALVLSACADNTAVQPAVSSTNAKPKYKKPVRMNGRGEISSVSLEEFFALQQSGKVMIYDARPAFFYQIGHIPGAVSLPKNDCDEKIAAREGEIKAALASGRKIITYCTSFTCPDARSLAMHISGFGYPVSVFSGGWDAWKDAGMPVE